MALVMAQTSKKRYDAIDQMKFICAILVVAIHAVPFSEFSPLWSFEIEQVVTRIAVPFFFVSSGFFFMRKLMTADVDPLEAVRALVKRLGWLYAAWCGIYFAYDFRLCLRETSSFGEAAALYLRNLIFLGGHFHLWYLPALMVSLLLLYAGYRMNRMGQFLGAAALLYIVGLAGNSYYGFIEGTLWLQRIFETYFQLFVTTRNGLFFGFLYVMLGGMVAYRKEIVPFRTGIQLAAVFLLLMHVEAYLLEWRQIPKDYDMYAMAAPCTFFLFQGLLGAGKELKSHVSAFFRTCSMGVYFIHGIFLIFYEKLFQWLGAIPMGTIYFLLVALSSVASVWLLSKIKSPQVQRLIR